MMDALKKQKWYRVPLTLVLVGLLSILLFSALDRTWKRQQINAASVETILALEVDTALFHLGIEEILAGESHFEVADAVVFVERGIGRADLLLSGAGPQRELVRSLGLSPAALELKNMLVSFREQGVTRTRDPDAAGPDSAADIAFDAQFDQILEKARAMEAVCAAGRAQTGQESRRVVHALYVAWGAFLVGTTALLWGGETRRRRAELALLDANDRLQGQAAELSAHRGRLEELVRRRTAALLEANETLRAEIAVRVQAEGQLRESERQIRRLSAELLGAQEAERRRISMELHDELGQALNVMKLEVRGIERELKPAQAGARRDCEKLLGYLDEEIEEVRRLSLALSPTVLDDLGLAAALRWLISSLQKAYPLRVEAKIDEIDHLFPPGHRVTIYRVIQEALSNVERHAQAACVRLSIRHSGAWVEFEVVDDGRGFDPDQVRKAGERPSGMGLGTMMERVRMLGGELRLTSRPGGGALVAFALPVTAGEV